MAFSGFTIMDLLKVPWEDTTVVKPGRANIKLPREL